MKKLTQLSNEELAAQLSQIDNVQPAEINLTEIPNDELISQLGQAEEPSVATMGASYFKEHPFKTIFEPATKTMTGKSIADRMTEGGVNTDAFVAKERPYDSKLKFAKPIAATETFMKGTAGTIADIATTPASAIPLPIKAAGRIPIGSTNVGRIASNVAVGKGFGKGIKDLQALESHLQKIGKTSSRGVPIGLKYDEAVKPAVIAIHNTLNSPSAGSLKTRGQFTARDEKLFEGYQVLNDFVGPNKPKDIDEALSAINQAKSEVYGMYSSQASDASTNGAMIDLARIAKRELEPLLSNEQIKTHRKGLMPAIENYIADFTRRGKVTLAEAQKDLETLNGDIGKFLKSGSPDEQNLGAIKLAISKAIRNSADNSIEETLGKGGYQALRNKYGAVKAVEDELLRAYAKQLKPKQGISGPILDIMAGKDLAEALVSSVSKDTVGAGKNFFHSVIDQGIKKGLAWKNNPNRRIPEIFSKIEKAKSSSKAKTIVMPNRTGSLIKPVNQGLADTGDIGGLYAEPVVSRRPVRAQFLPPRESRTSMAYAKGEPYVPQGVKPNPKRIEKGSIIKQGKLLKVKMPKVEPTKKEIAAKTPTADPYGYLAEAKKNMSKGLAAGGVLLGASSAQADMASNKNVDMTIRPDFKKKLDIMDRLLKKEGVEVKIVQGRRTQKQQDDLYAQGRTKPGKVVTWTRNSNHLDGRAVDVMVIKNGKPTWDPKEYKALERASKAAGLNWGGNFKKNKDWGHIELPKASGKYTLKPKAKR